eukprot:CAMPEP_0113280212 /NCGR_PEP_ID=MMETSP0008_2-20120614/27613_1 /TAXON_ID=97485 /ORGANISM="Prymnesium parvum" /LENGTH=34 /DNA_ID=CAMNT_0000130479 /DNA_START=132 /DNA_END=236 /DNA_ORIENTATION=+ /assembly_acc=CAM_ASM_000153
MRHVLNASLTSDASHLSIKGDPRSGNGLPVFQGT